MNDVRLVISVQAIAQTLPDADLKEAIQHLRAMEDTHVPPPQKSALRSFVDRIENDFRVDDIMALAIGQIALITAAAYRWADISDERQNQHLH